jgi:hypothetical protein
VRDCFEIPGHFHARARRQCLYDFLAFCVGCSRTATQAERASKDDGRRGGGADPRVESRGGGKRSGRSENFWDFSFAKIRMSTAPVVLPDQACLV